MGIYDNSDEFDKMAKEYGGTASTSLLPPALWKDSLLCWLDFLWHFIQFSVVLALLAFNFIVWWDIISFLGTNLT